MSNKKVKEISIKDQLNEQNAVNKMIAEQAAQKQSDVLKAMLTNKSKK